VGEWLGVCVGCRYLRFRSIWGFERVGDGLLQGHGSARRPGGCAGDRAQCGAGRRYGTVVGSAITGVEDEANRVAQCISCPEQPRGWFGAPLGSGDCGETNETQGDTLAPAKLAGHRQSCFHARRRLVVVTLEQGQVTQAQQRQRGEYQVVPSPL
jgi:hypothetical protein